MAQQVALSPDAGAPISLYLDLEDPQKPDLEVIARAALAFSGAIREAAEAIDPFTSIRVEFISSTDGSISLNAMVRSIRSGADRFFARQTLFSIAVTAATWFALETSHWTYDKILDHISGIREASSLSEEDKSAIANKVVEMLETRVAHQRVEMVYHDTTVRINAGRDP
jgi:hypothetical protein